VVLDTSAIIAILTDEPDGARYISALAGATDPMISAANLVESSIVMLARTGPSGVKDLDELLAVSGVRCVAVDSSQAMLAREAFARFGKGRSPVALNFGDCFAYALARATGQPLLFKGEHFSKTDILAAAT
jgi:ribonuclease VapC